MENNNSVLMIFTGGTISMTVDPQTGALRPADFDSVKKLMPELEEMRIRIEGIPLLPLVDSSDINPDVWERIALIIEEHYQDFDGFVVLHGTDTMAFSASALSFMLTGLTKPVIFTGSQIPIGVLRTDAKENLITAVEIASAKKNGKAVVPEVCVFFEDKLFRANRTTKQNSEHFSAFKSFNYPALAEAGVHIKYFYNNIYQPSQNARLRVRTKTDRNIAILKIFPGITEQTVNGVLQINGLKAVILETFGAGNAPRGEWFYKALRNAAEQGIIIVNKSQCSTGSVEMGLYETSLNLLNAGVISGYDATTEALVAKLMYLLGENNDLDKVKQLMIKNLCGEITVK
ncbi:MAG: asparaginase [Paludibacteraceae bacterium]